MNKNPVVRLIACRLKTNTEISPDKIYKFNESGKLRRLQKILFKILDYYK